MNGVVSLLNEPYYGQVEALWQELEARFGVRGVYVTPYPHFSYQIARHYDVEKLEAVLERFAAGKKAFRVRAGGLGIFTGASPVLYIPVVRGPALSRFQQELWEQISPTGSGISEYYGPDQWMPHITIGFGDLNADTLSQIVRLLAERVYNWEITVDNLALIYDTGTRQVLKSRFELGT